MCRCVKALVMTLLLLGPARLRAEQAKPSLLFCSPQGATYGWVDLAYLAELHQKGFEVDYTEKLEDVTEERIQRYNVLVIYVTPDAYRVTMRNVASSAELVRSFAELIDRYVASGGGVLLMPTEHNMRKQAVADLTSRWGAKLPVERIEETDREKLATLDHASQQIPIAFTDQVLPSPVSEGVEQIWYPYAHAYNAQQTGPVAVDESWQVVVRGSQTAVTRPVDLAASSMPVLEDPFIRPGGVKQPALMAVRDYGRGRVALVNQWRQHSIGAGTKYIYDRQILSKGVGDRPSHFGRLLENTFRWLAEPSLASRAVGGYVTDPQRLLAPNRNPQVTKEYADRFWPYDAATLGTVPLSPHRKLYRGLIGAKTTYSSGTGSVEDYAKAAAAAGLDFLVFLDDFHKLTPDKLAQLKNDCDRHSNETIRLLPGFSIENNIGNRMFFYSPDPAWVPDYCLTGPDKNVLYIQEEDGQGNYTGYLTPFLDWVLGAYHVDKGQVGYYDFSASPHGMRLADLRLYAMAAVRYYRSGRLVEDNTDAYLTTAQGTIPPAPASVNEVTSPEELTREVASGHALLHAEARSLETLFGDALRWTHQYDGPNVFTSDGPRILAWPGCYRVWTLGGEQFVTGRAVMPSPLYVLSDAGLKEIRIYNGRELFRRFLPGGADEFRQTLVLDGTVQKNLVLVAEDAAGRRAVSFARRCWKDGALAPVFCSDHVNDGSMGLTHGPFHYPCIRDPFLPDDVAGATWDGGPRASLPLTGHQNTAPVLESDKGKEDGSRFNQIPLLEFSDEGAVAVQSPHREVFDERVERVVNPWHTYGPLAGPSRLIEYVQRYREWVPPTVGAPETGWAAPGVRMGTNAALFENRITFKEDLKIESLKLGYFSGNPGATLALSTEGRLRTFDFSQSKEAPTFTLNRGDWFGYYSPRIANSNLFINRGEPFRITVRPPYVFFEADLVRPERLASGSGGTGVSPVRGPEHGQDARATQDSSPQREPGNVAVKKGDTFSFEIAAIGFPVNVEIRGADDLSRYLDYLKAPAGMEILRGTRLDSPGLLELAPDADSAVEIRIPKPARKLDFTLPCRIVGLNPRWSAGLWQKQGYVKGHYGSGANRYRTLGTDLDGCAYLPLYVDRASTTHVVAGHPVVAGPEAKDLFIQVTHVGRDPDRWHVSVNNPTDQPVATTLKKSIELPGFEFPPTTLKLKPGEYVVLR